MKRVAIARALAAEPKCLIFDEATNGFDLPLRKKIIEEIIVLQKQLGFPCFGGGGWGGGGYGEGQHHRIHVEVKR